MTRKVCTKCQRSLPITDFYRHPRGKDGRHSQCKDCIRAYMRAYYRGEINPGPPRQVSDEQLARYEVKIAQRTHRYQQQAMPTTTRRTQ